MEKLIAVARKLDVLCHTQGKLAKQAFIKDNKDDEDFLSLLKARLSPYIQYHIKTLPRIAYSTMPTLTYREFTALLYKLSTNNINAALRKEVEQTLAKAHHTIGETLEGIITKSLNLGVDTSVNKALGYELIPSFDVMLAAPLKEGVVVPIPCQVDLKYDGVRFIAIVEAGGCELFTRQGRPLNFPKLEKEFVQFAKGENIAFDGELEMTSRTGISGVCNSNLKTGYVEGSDDLIEAYIFDEIPAAIFRTKGKTKIQSERTLDLQKRFATFQHRKRLRPAESQTVHSLEKLKEISNQYIKDGFEGVIAKDPNAVYHYKRNKAWLKLKAINSTTLRIVGVEAGKGKRKGKVGALVCRSECGNIVVNVGSGLTDEDVELFTTNPPIGRFVEVLFNVLIKGRDSDKYSLFLPRYKEMRIDKTEADTLKKVLSEHIGKVME